jgi:hypothetical protein
MAAHDLRPGIYDVRKDARRAAKYVVFKDHACIDGDVVLNLDVIAYHHIIGYEYILSKHAPLAYARAFRDVAEVPYLRIRADLCPVIYEA